MTGGRRWCRLVWEVVDEVEEARAGDCNQNRRRVRGSSFGRLEPWPLDRLECVEDMLRILREGNIRIRSSDGDSRVWVVNSGELSDGVAGKHGGGNLGYMWGPPSLVGMGPPGDVLMPADADNVHISITRVLARDHLVTYYERFATRLYYYYLVHLLYSN